MSNRKLLEIKQRLTDARTGKARAEGVIQSIRGRLKNEFGCKDETAAQRKLKEMDKEIFELNEMIKAGIKDLEESYDWGD